ncbi:MAG: HAD-IA family hydrolase [Alphaproteobacteria bacterium]|nr:HAD-IA family hydrolase [Alphaproteobacteria bacterium]
MPLKTPTIVIFDMDGTVVRHLSPWVLHVLERLDDAWYTAARLFRWFGRRRAQDPILPPPEEMPPRRKPRLLVHRAIHKVRRKEVDQIVEPCPGIYDVLELLKSEGIPVALISNGLGQGYGEDIVQKFGLDQYFSATVFREDIRKSKPDPEALLAALSHLQITPGQDDAIWYIGDRHKDITAALALESHIPAQIVPVAYGVNAAVEAVKKGIGPEHIIMSYYDMHARLEKLMNAAGRDKQNTRELDSPANSSALAPRPSTPAAKARK